MWQNPNAISSTIQSKLKSGERLLWNGKPQGGIRFRSSDAFLIPFSLMWGGFAVSWEVSVILSSAPFFFKLWGIPFVLAGIYIIFGRFIVDAKNRDKTIYAVTNQRIIIISALFGRKIKSLNLRTLPELTLNEKSDGSGTITFGSTSAFNVWGNPSWPGTAQTQVPSFEMINNARQVYNTIQAVQQQPQ
jgi:hypothetical protein